MRKLILGGVSFLGILITLYACRKEKVPNSEPEFVQLSTPVEFRSWFNKRFSNNQIKISGFNNALDTIPNQQLILEPVWTKGINYKRGDSLITEVPLVNGNIVFSRNKIDPKSFDYSKAGSVNSLLLIKADSTV